MKVGGKRTVIFPPEAGYGQKGTSEIPIKKNEIGDTYSKTRCMLVYNLSSLKFCEMGDGTKIKFWLDIWCGSCSLKDGYPDLFRIACDKEALVVDHMCFQNGAVSWVLNFTRPAQDWELESIASFLKLLYSSSAKGQGEDRLCWQGSASGAFQVKAYYKALLPTAGHIIPWKSIWKTRAPPRVAFFVWAAALGRILTIDNLRKREVIVINWCYMCKGCGESIAHLLLHCLAAREIWNFIFSMFNILWVMPCGVMDLLYCWGHSCCNVRIQKIWDLIPSCVFWYLWRERNSRSFEGKENSLMEIKLIFIRTLMEWSKAAGATSCTSVLDFISFIA